MGTFTDKHARLEVTPYRPRLIVWAGSHKKLGKTTFAMTAPGPNAYFDIDVGMEEIHQQFREGRFENVLTGEVFDPDIRPVPLSQKWSTQKEFQLEAQNFEENYRDALKDETVPSISIDTWGELRSLEASAILGPGAVVPGPAWKPVSDKMTQLLDLGLTTPGKNIILLSHLKPQYAQAIDPVTGEPSKKITDSYQTGRYLPGSESECLVTGKKVHCYIELSRVFKPTWFDVGGKPISNMIKDERHGLLPADSEGKPLSNWRDLDHHKEDHPTGEFYFTIHFCRHDTALDRQVVTEPLNTFPNLATMVHSNTRVEDWV